VQEKSGLGGKIFENCTEK